jgi:uncharacterized protein
MKILLDRLTDSPTRLHFEAEPAWWRDAKARLPELDGAAADSFHVDVEAHRMGSDLYLAGTIEGRFELGCSRCLARYGQPLRETFRLVLEPAGERTPADPESAVALVRDGMCLGDELETGWFRGHEIDLGPYLLELVTLAVPVQPLCRADCRGLCPRCGVDRNNETCRCEETSPSSPFAALSRLRVGQTGGES